MKKELRFCIVYVCPTHPLNDDGSVNVRHFRTLSEEEAENALVLLLECGCKLIDLYRGNVQDGKLAEWSPLPMIVNQNEDFYVDGDFDSYLNKGKAMLYFNNIVYENGYEEAVNKMIELLDKRLDNYDIHWVEDEYCWTKEMFLEQLRKEMKRT